jgi:RNA polymerase sigma-32 factor
MDSKKVNFGEAKNMSNFVESDELKIYLSQIENYPILTREEESHLAVLYRDNNDKQAAHILITSNLRFVIKVALGYRN